MSLDQYLAPGARVQVRSATLQAFYGCYGTVLRVHTCRNDGRPTYVDVQMDETLMREGPATFYPHEIQALAEQAGRQSFLQQQ
jgi:hypothetical protein